MNKVYLSGTVAIKPEMRRETGKPEQASFQMNAWHRAEDGQWWRETYTVCCQERRAHWAMANIEAGQRIAVEGMLMGAEKVRIAVYEIVPIGAEKGTMEAKHGATRRKTQRRTGIDPWRRKWYHMGSKSGCGSFDDKTQMGRLARMKKRLLSMFLALVMQLGMAVCGGAEDARPKGERTEGAQEELHMLWDIPWGSTPEEVMRLAEERAGVKLYVSGDVELKDARYLKSGRQEITLLGVPLTDMRFGFNEDGLRMAEAGFLIENRASKRQFAAEGMSLIRNVYEAIALKYGMLTDSFLSRIIEHKDSYEVTRYYFPVETGKIDYALLSQILEENESVYLDLYWYNVMVNMTFEQAAGYVSGYFIWRNEEKRNGFNREPQLYPKRSGYLTLEEELSRTGPAVNVGI